MSNEKKTPTAGLEAIFYFPAIDLVLRETALKSYLRVQTHHRSNWDGLGRNNAYGHLRWCKAILDNLGVNPNGLDKTLYLNLNRRYKVDLESKNSGQPISVNSTQCYTDGSRLANRSGYGFFITQGISDVAKSNGYLGENATVFQSEVYAIQKASGILRDIDTDSVTIFTDSQAALNALAKMQITSKVVQNCILELNILAKTKDVEIKWVKSHIGIHGNEEADELAKSGTKKVVEEVIPLPKRMAINIIEEATRKLWDQRWSNSSECRQTKQWFPTTNRAKSKLLLRQDKNSLGLIVQLISGHNRLRYQESKMNQDVSPLCRAGCTVDETSWHIVCECPALWKLRAEVFNTYHNISAPLKWSVQQIKKLVKNSRVIELLQGEQDDLGLP